MFYPASIARLIEALTQLPGVGPKSAQRLAFYLLHAPRADVERFMGAITEARERIRYCSVCFNLTEADPCPICANPARDHGTICVVEEPRDVIAMEKTREYKGVYHVLHGTINPMEGIGPGEIRLRELMQRLSDPGVQEVIVSTNPTTEGEATAIYIARAIKPLGIKVTRIARGLPIGGDLEYADEVTLAQALEGRREM